jgi:hypothetical protein
MDGSSTETRRTVLASWYMHPQDAHTKFLVNPSFRCRSRCKGFSCWEERGGSLPRPGGESGIRRQDLPTCNEVSRCYEAWYLFEPELKPPRHFAIEGTPCSNFHFPDGRICVDCFACGASKPARPNGIVVPSVSLVSRLGAVIVKLAPFRRLP